MTDEILTEYPVHQLIKINNVSMDYVNIILQVVFYYFVIMQGILI